MKSQPNDGGPAFPVCFEHQEATSESPGMSLRDYFAAKALQGIRAAKMKSLDSNTGDLVLWSSDATAQLAYADADAMLKARER